MCGIGEALGFSLGLRKVCWIDLSWMWVCGDFAQTLGWGRRRASPSVVDAGDVAVVSHGVCPYRHALDLILCGVPRCPYRHALDLILCGDTLWCPTVSTFDTRWT